MGQQAAFIGSQVMLLKTPEFAEIFVDYKNIKKNSLYYDKKIDYNQRLTKWNPGSKLLAVKYQDNKFQFSELRTVSNERYLAVQFLKKLEEQGVRMEGEYKSLKNIPQQFTKKSWITMSILIGVVTFIFIIVSIIVVGIFGI